MQKPEANAAAPATRKLPVAKISDFGLHVVSSLCGSSQQDSKQSVLCCDVHLCSDFTMHGVNVHSKTRVSHTSMLQLFLLPLCMITLFLHGLNVSVGRCTLQGSTVIFSVLAADAGDASLPLPHHFRGRLPSAAVRR
jgi:hypothetical protein